jgi:hypothetical protein
LQIADLRLKIEKVKNQKHFGRTSPLYPAHLAAIQFFCAIVAIFVRDSTYFSTASFTLATLAKHVKNREVFAFWTQIICTIIQPWFTSTIHKKT